MRKEHNIPLGKKSAAKSPPDLGGAPPALIEKEKGKLVYNSSLQRISFCMKTFTEM